MATAPLRALLPLPAGAERMVVETDGTIVYDTGACRAVIRVDLVTLDSLAPEDQDYVCGLHNRLCATLAANQTLQMIVESDPLPSEGVIGMLRRSITTEGQALRALVPDTLESIRTEMARTHVPDKRAYLIVAPAPEPAIGLAGMTQGVKEAIGLGTKGAPDPDRYGLDTAVEDVVSVCQAMGLRAQRLRGGEVVSLLWRCAHPGVPEPENLIAAEDLTGALAPTDWEEGLRDVRVSDIYTRSLYVLEPPDRTSPGWLDDLVSLDATLRLSWHVRGRDREPERTRQLKRRQRLLGVAAARRLGDPETEDAGAEAEALAEQLLAADVAVVWSTLIVTLQAPDRATLDRATSRARRILRTRLAVPFGWGRGYQRALWRASLPFGVDVARRARRWHSYSVGNGLPFLAHSPGTATGMPLGFTTRGHELVLLDLVDPSLPNAVGIFAGRPGMGKTITLNRLGLWSLYAGRRVCFVDPAGHFGPLVELAGGELVAPGKQRAPKTVNLWDLPAGTDLAEKLEHLVAAHEIMLTKRGEDLTPLHRSLLDAAAQRVYTDHGLVEGGDAGDLPPLLGPDAPLEGEMVAHLWAMADDAGRTLGEQEMLRQMHAALQQYVGRGRYARLVERPTTADLQAHALSFDLGELPDHVYDLLMFTVTTTMAGRAKSMYDATRGTSLEVLIADELWGMTERASAGHAIKDTALRSRHRGLAFLGATQQVSVLADNPVAKALLDAASLKGIYRLHDVRGGGDRSTVEYLCDVLHAPAETAERLRSLRMGQMMLFRESKDGTVRHGEVDVMLPALERWLMTTEPWHDVPARNAAIARCGSVAAAIKHLAATER